MKQNKISKNKKRENVVKRKKIFLFSILFVVFCFCIFMTGYTVRENVYKESYSDAKQSISSGENLEIPNLCYSDVQIPNFFDRGNKVSAYINNDVNDKIITLDYNSLNRTIYLSYVLPTGSMRPAISDNSTLILAKVESERDINIGDVISIDRNSSDKNAPRLLHRVVNIIHEEKGDVTYYITKGDNNIEDDEEAFGVKATFDMIVGKVVGIIY